MHVQPDSTAMRTALWRALHVEVDDPPHLIEDDIGRQLVDPPGGWRERGDMDPQGTMPYRAGIVARTRHVEDLLADEGIGQYVLLGAGLDTFAQRRPAGTGDVTVFEIDQPGAQAWKRGRLRDLGHEVGDRLRLVPVDFEADGDWWAALLDAGFDPSARGAEASGTPWISFYRPEEMEALVRESGFSEVRIVSTVELTERHLAGRADELRAASGEALLIART